MMAAIQPLDGEARARALLDAVHDPELPGLSIADLGILRGVEASAEAVSVTLTPTYSGCPATTVIEIAVRDALLAGGFRDIRVETALSPAWTTDWITERGRAALRELGIAPPVRGSACSDALFADAPAVPCPRCGSAATERVSEFGSTACKAQYRCTACHEPFHYFKCI